jgi:hypothetical protein
MASVSRSWQTVPVVDLWADHVHYLDHAAPIWNALPAEARGSFIVPKRLMAEAKARGVRPTCLNSIAASNIRWSTNVMIVCAWGGVLRWRRNRRKLVLLNHGAGQTYTGGHPAYSGGEGRERVDLFIEPGPHAAEATLRTLPSANVVQVGCAKLDGWHSGVNALPVNDKPVVAFSSHWDCKVSPEAAASWHVYKDALLGLKDDYVLLAHAHPLIASKVRAAAGQAGVEFVEHFDDVLRRADVYISDNSSTLYEFASTGRPVLCLNLPSYRRDVHHGLRFWDAVPGVECDTPEELPSKLKKAFADGKATQRKRQHAVGRAYVACDGNASERAAQAIVDFCEGLAS